MKIDELLKNEAMLEIGRKAVEDTLIEFRDSRISVFMRGNGLVIREKDGTESSCIRLGIDDALRIALKAVIRSERKSKMKGNKE